MFALSIIFQMCPSVQITRTHLSYKINAILTKYFTKVFFLRVQLIKSVLAEVTAWCWTSAKLVPEKIITQFTDYKDQLHLDVLDPYLQWMEVWNNLISHESQILICHNQGVVNYLSLSPIKSIIKKNSVSIALIFQANTVSLAILIQMRKSSKRVLVTFPDYSKMNTFKTNKEVPGIHGGHYGNEKAFVCCTK